MLDVKDIHAGYGQIKVLQGVSLSVSSGEILCVMGRNGAGKTTLMKSIMNLIPISSGEITLDQKLINKLPSHEIPKCGVGYIPQGRRLFPELTVDENIEMGLLTRKVDLGTKEWVLDLFPILKERLDQRAGTLSGGEQQMLATARALALQPKVLLLDEPTEGLQPSIVKLIHEVIVKMKSQGFAIILVEQHIDTALSLADHITIIENGKTIDAFNAKDLKSSSNKIRKYLGV